MIYKLRTLIIIAFALTPMVVNAQAPEKNIHHREQLWVGYFNQTRLSNKWGLWLDVQHRLTDNFADRSFQFLFRPAITYFIKDNLRVNVGYGYIHHFPAKGMETHRNEHRPWQQIWWTQKYSGLTTLQWLRFEQRFNEKVVADEKQDGYNYNFRIRYNFSFFIPLKGKEIVAKTPFISLGNELFLNFGDRTVYNTFDQNRLFAGMGYQFTKNLNVQLGYLNVYQQEASGNNYVSSHAARVAVFHNLDFRSTTTQ
ncbi:DUF2490 domain-containing protein [Pseudochryseolinea flava]|uniref:DUF2490 domain-containing protein n=1 Tax=Pseudochryseolinea flava TaxID=2059302 RepID=A0A364XZP7_9BACT|nr:DUF2490 domain-containing protein [Pseudochryseolinea flava]RAV99993.1 DUF2490 domain-containing protein [Pseudochryseolinea flava]